MEDKMREYLQRNEYIKIRVKKEELKDGTYSRYLALLDEVSASQELLRKFCGRLLIDMEGDLGAELWRDAEARRFAAIVCERYDNLFFLCEKQSGTMKLLALLYSAGQEAAGEDIALDAERFNSLLRQQLRGIVETARKLHFEPEEAEDIIGRIYSYFGMEPA